MQINYIDITIREMFDAAYDNSREIIYENKNSSYYSNLLNAILSKDIYGIRTLFKDGFTMLMLPSPKMLLVDHAFNKYKVKNFMIRVFTDDGVLLGCIVNDEINY